MSIIVHGRASSSNVQVVMWGAAELGLEIERRDVGGRFGGTDEPAFRAMNPMGKVPVVQDGALTMFESAAILRYLVTTYGPGPLTYGPMVDMWAEWAKHTLCRGFILDVFWPYYRQPEADRDMDVVLAALRAFEEHCALAMRLRCGQTWMFGDQISLADLWVGHVLFRYFTLDLPHQAPEGLRAFYDAVLDRPAFCTHVMIDYSELKGRTSF